MSKESLIGSVHRLHSTKCYLMGAMENANGEDWRAQTKQSLKETGITFFDPYHKPFINEVKENERARKVLKNWMKKGQFDKAAQRMKQVRSDDLRLCDLSDFGIVQVLPTVPTWGTVEEVSWFVRCKKPLFIFVQGGKCFTPLWIMGMIPHKYIYNSLEEVVTTLKKIDSGRKKLDNSRWKLLQKEYR